jgi:hypothetical protein
MKNKILIFINLFIVLNSSIYAQSFVNKCYTFSKNNFILIEDKMIENYFEKEVELSSDIIIDFQKDVQYGITSIVSLSKPAKYNSGGVFSCYYNENKYSCDQDDDGGRFDIKVENNKLSIRLDFARLADNPDVPLMQTIKSKYENFIKGKEIKCIHLFI